MEPKRRGLPRVGGRVRFVGAVTLPSLALLVLLERVGLFVPFALAIAILVLGRTVANPRFGLTATIVAVLLIPIPLNFRVGAFTLSIGRIVGFAFLLGWLTALSRRNGPVLRRTGMEFGIVALLLAYGVSLAANSPMLDRREFTVGLREILFFAVDYFGFFFAAVSILAAGERHLDRALHILGYTIVLIAGLGLVEKVTGRNVFTYLSPVLPQTISSYIRAIASVAQLTRGSLTRVRATFEGPPQLGAVLTMTLPLLLHLAGIARGAARKTAWWGGVAATVLVTFFTGSRSAFIALAVGLAIYGLAARGARMSRRSVLGVVGLGFVVLLALPDVRDTMVLYFRGLTTLQEAGVRGRLARYHNVARQFDRTPIAGSGPGTWDRAALLKSDRVNRNDPNQLFLDNNYLGIIATTGLLGLIGLLGVFGGGVGLALGGLRRARSPTERSLRAALLASVAVYPLLCYFFDMLAFYGPTKLYLFLLAAVAVGSGRARPIAPSDVDLSFGVAAGFPASASARGVELTDLRHVGSVIGKRRVMVATVTILITLGTVGAIELAARPFIAVDALDVQEPILLSGGQEGLRTAQKLVLLLPTYAELATSDAVLREVAATTGRRINPNRLRSQISVQPGRGLTLAVFARDDSPARAEQLAHATADALTAELRRRELAVSVPAEHRLVVSSLEQLPARRSARHLGRDVSFALIIGIALGVAVGAMAEYLSPRA